MIYGARAMSDGERELSDEMQRDAAPDEEVLWQTSPTARKSHTCDCCPMLITKGQRYNRTVLVEDGELKVYREHWRCPVPEGKTPESHADDCIPY